MIFASTLLVSRHLRNIKKDPRFKKIVWEQYSKNQHSDFQFDLEAVKKKSRLVECPLLNSLLILFIWVRVLYIIRSC